MLGMGTIGADKGERGWRRVSKWQKRTKFEMKSISKNE